MRLEQLSRLRAMAELGGSNPWGLSLDDKNAIAAAIAEMPNGRLLEALEAVLLFHSGSPWDLEKRLHWDNITKQSDATTKGLCDFIRGAVGSAQEKVRIVV